MTADIRKALIQKAKNKTITSDEVVMLASELEIWVDMALRAERCIHDLIKDMEKNCI